MNVLVIAGSALLIVGVAIVAWALLKPKKNGKARTDKNNKELSESYEKMMQDNVYQIFNKEFHEELRNKARLDFQRVINENAMFLQQDLRNTTTELNSTLKKDISDKLQQEFLAYSKTIEGVQKMAVDSINQTLAASQQLQQELNARMQAEAEQAKAQKLQEFEGTMAEVVNHYLSKTIGEQIDLKDQMPYILREMEAQKEAMKKDMWL